MASIKEVLFQSDLETITNLVKSGESWDIDDFMTAQTMQKALKEEKFELVEALIENDIISLDIFEYDRFTSSIFDVLLNLPQSDAITKYTLDIIERTENIDEELEGKTLLEHALNTNGSLPLMEAIIHAGCPVDGIDKNEKTYLFKTINTEYIQFFIDQGLDLNKQDNAGNTAFWNIVASKNKELIQCFLDNGAEVNIQNKKGETIYDVICFELMDIDLFKTIAAYDPPRFDIVDKNGQSLFFKKISMPSFGNDAEFISLMLEYGADMFQEEKDAYGTSMTAADELIKKPFELFQLLKTNDYLDVTVLDNNGNTWLHKVCKVDLNFDESKAKDLYKKVKILLSLGADPHVKNDEDKSAIDYAQDDNLKAKALSLLLKH